MDDPLSLLFILVISAAFSIALGKAMERSRMPSWAQWSVLAFLLAFGYVLYVTQVQTGD